MIVIYNKGKEQYCAFLLRYCFENAVFFRFTETEFSAELLVSLWQHAVRTECFSFSGCSNCTDLFRPCIPDHCLLTRQHVRRKNAALQHKNLSSQAAVHVFSTDFSNACRFRAKSSDDFCTVLPLQYENRC